MIFFYETEGVLKSDKTNRMCKTFPYFPNKIVEQTNILSPHLLI